MIEFITADALTALLQVILIDLVLAGDNAIVIGLAAAGLPAEQRAKAILVGIVAATVLRIVLRRRRRPSSCRSSACCSPAACCCCGCAGRCGASCATCHAAHDAAEALSKPMATPTALAARRRARPSRRPRWQIVVADVSMSLDNVLAVAGAAREHPYVLVFGLVLSIALMGIAANFIARAAAEASLDRLCRPRHHPLRRRRHDLSRFARARARHRESPRRQFLPAIRSDP